MINETKAMSVITEAFTRKRFLNVGYLVTKYSSEDLQTLLHFACETVTNLNKSILVNTYAEYGLTNFEAFALKSFIDSQILFFNNAISHLNKNFDTVTIEGNVINFELMLN